MQGTSKIRLSLEDALRDLASNDPTNSQQFFHQFCSTLNSVEEAISKEIAEQEENASCLLRSIELIISEPEYQSSKQEATFDKVAREQVENSKNLSASIQEFTKAIAEVCRIADTKGSFATSMQETLQERLSSKPWIQASLTKIVVLYSDIFEAIQELKEATKTAGGKAGVWVAPDSFERKTTKYWVPEENLPQLLMTCASEAPFLVYGTTGRLSRAEDIPLDDLWKNLSSQISSIYFDSPELDLYKERIKRREGAQLLRARWYGEKPPTPNEPVFLELKTHHESWIQAKSVKERVAILEKDMNSFLYSMKSIMSEGLAESLVLAATPKLKGDKLAKAVDLLLRMHALVVRHKLRPCMRSTYDRLAFQSSKNNSLRLTLDRQVVVSDEQGCKYGEQWFMPFSHGEAKPDRQDQRTIPFAVFEIKLGEGQESTALNECIENGTILDAAKFSKFLTGAATFNRVNHLPYWASHPAFASFFSQLPSSPTKSWPPGDVSYRDGDESLTLSASSSFDTGNPQGRNQNKMSSFLAFFQRNTFVAPKKAVRIEPKTYFANERTFIQWVSAALFLVTTSALMLEFENGEGYAKSTATTLLIVALIISVYSVGLYFSRIWLMTNARPYGYISHFGPFVLTATAIAATWIILSRIRLVEVREELERSIEEARNKVRFIRAEPGVCMEQDISSFSPLQFEPSDAFVDLKRNQLLVPSLSEIYGFPLPDWNSEGILEIPNVSSTIVAQIELADFESATLVNDNTMYATSETDTETLEKSPHMYSLQRGAFGRFEVTGRWKLETLDPEGIVIVSHDKSSSFLVSGQNGEGPRSAVVQRFSVPEPNQISSSPNSSSTVASTPTLEARRNLNEKLLDENMEDPKIGAMTYFEGILYILHENARVVRAWDMESGTFRAEWPLPGVPNSSGKQWEGMAFQRIQLPRRSASINRSSSTNNPKQNLRRRLVVQPTDNNLLRRGAGRVLATDDDPRWRDDDTTPETVGSDTSQIPATDDDPRWRDDDTTPATTGSGTIPATDDDPRWRDDDTSSPVAGDPIAATDDDPRWRDDDVVDGTDADPRWDEDGDEGADEDEDEEEEEEEDEEDENADDDEEEVSSSVLVLHLTHDTPAAIWSIVVKEGEVKGSIEYPACANVFR